ncbi:Type II secretion system protein [Acidobacteriia bacterium SbA2]|nr:Type II secretion system protein [Acidobacteriia bacterium SbA2]
MPQINSQGTSRTGSLVSGVRAAVTRQAVGGALRRGPAAPVRTGLKRSAALAKPKVRGRVNPRELSIFTRQFSVMIDAGLPLVQCIDILADQQANKAFTEILRGVRKSVEGGTTLANALRDYPKVFDDLYTNMVEAGETGGILDGVLERLSTHIEKAVKLRRAVKSALIYPTAVVLIAGGVITLLLWKVVPIFATLFAGLEVALPLPTRIVIGLSNAVASFALPAVIILGAGGYGLKLFYGTPQGRLLIDRFILKLPLVGSLMRKISVGMFTRTLGTLISSGVPMLEAMEITARTSGNAVVEKAVMQVRRAIEAGRTIVDPLRETGVFPNLVVQMIGVGEQTGNLDAMLQKIADFYEDEVDVAVGDLLTAMEPMIILFLGVVVGGVVISMYLPLFSLIGKLAG